MVAAADEQTIIAEVAGIARLPGSVGERADALLGQLARITPFDAAHISLYDVDARRQVPVARYGYDSMVQRYLDSVACVAELERAQLYGSRRPLRVADLPTLHQVRGWSDYLYPAGFREGVGVGLFTGDGRFLGTVNINTGDPRPASDAACGLLHRLVPLIAAAVDPLLTATAAVALVTDATAGVVLARDGVPSTLPGLPDDALLGGGSPVLTAVRARLGDPPASIRFLCRRTGSGGLARVTALALPAQPASNAVAVALLGPPPPLHGLTLRELQVTGLLVEGWSNAAIAAALGVGVRTVVAHLEHIMTKLGATSRTMAAVQSQQRGIYIPKELTAASKG